MAISTSALPTKFPCWCRAVYSWGGETDKDLGFIEGDLIECLNAGDGSWWTGRLRRDRRMLGLFPSNFVVVLDESFVPASRSVSPMPALQNAGGKNSAMSLEEQKQKAKSRRPFQGYKSAVAPSPSQAVSSSPQHSAPDTPTKRETFQSRGRPTPTKLRQELALSYDLNRASSPMLDRAIGSSPPPPPPPHRVALGSECTSRAASPRPQYGEFESQHQDFARTPSPGLVSLNGHTPPMLRSAMDDVMSSLQDMGMARRESQAESEVAFNPWSPEAFDDLARPSNRPDPRPLTSLGLAAGGSNYSESRQNYSSRHNYPDQYNDGPPQLETYVQRMESRLRQMQEAGELQNGSNMDNDRPDVPPKNSPWSRPVSAMASRAKSIRNRKSASELGKAPALLDRTLTTKTNSTSSSSGARSNVTVHSTQSSMTSQSIMSGHSAGAFSATSAGSLARHQKFGYGDNRNIARPLTSAGTREAPYNFDLRPQTPLTGISYHSSHDSVSRQGARSAIGWDEQARADSSSGLGGFTTPKVKKSGFFKNLVDRAKTGAASARSNVPVSQAGAIVGSPARSNFNNSLMGVSGGMSPSTQRPPRSATSNSAYGINAAREMGLDTGNEWVTMRRDVNRSNTPGPTERQERANRCQILDYPVISPIEELCEMVEGDEGAEGHPVSYPFQLSNPSFTLVDKAARFITSLPATITAAVLATGYVCRPHRTDVQRLRAIFTWCAERLTWNEDFDGQVDLRRVIQGKRGCSREVAVLVAEMCAAIGIHAEVVHGYLKTPGEELNLDALMRGGNHFWNTLLVDGEWRMMDASLAGPTNPKRSLYSSVSSSIAEAWYFLAKPSDFCYTHVPLDENQQKMVPPVSPDVLLALPTALPPYFRMSVDLHNYDTSSLRLDGLELCTLAMNVPADVEIVAEVETKSYLRDQDGDLYENVDAVTKHRSLVQASWYAPSGNPNVLQKRYIVKALLPGDEGMGILKVYAGKKGLMHSSKDIVHPLAMALPLYHQGENPPYEFVTRHPTPHAMRQDLYVVQPQCRKLCAGETYVFVVRQHASSIVATPAVEQNGFDFRPVSPNPMMRPGSAMSMTSSAAGSNPSEQGGAVTVGVKVKDKPAKLAVQSPGGKIIRLNRKAEHTLTQSGLIAVDGETQGSAWEAVLKVQERGLWRGLVLADRSARWCVWGEWECV